MKINWDAVFTFLYVVPSLAWFFAAFSQIYKSFQANKDKIKTVTQEQIHAVQTLAEKAQNVIQEKLHDPKDVQEPPVQEPKNPQV
jgi:hypothetical protein